MNPKIVTLNTLKHKHLENEVKMHFIYLQQSSAHSNPTQRLCEIIFVPSPSLKPNVGIFIFKTLLNFKQCALHIK